MLWTRSLIGARTTRVLRISRVSRRLRKLLPGNVEYAKSMAVLVGAGFLHQGSSSDSYAVQTDSSSTVYASTTMNMIPVPVPAAVATQTTTAFCPPEMMKGVIHDVGGTVLGHHLRR